MTMRSDFITVWCDVTTVNSDVILQPLFTVTSALHLLLPLPPLVTNSSPGAPTSRFHAVMSSLPVVILVLYERTLATSHCDISRQMKIQRQSRDLCLNLLISITTVGIEKKAEELCYNRFMTLYYGMSQLGYNFDYQIYRPCLH